MGIFAGHFTKQKKWWRNAKNGRHFVEKTDEILIDPLNKLRIDLNNAPSDPADANILVAVSKNEYNKNKFLLDTIYLSCSILKTNVLSAVDLMTDEDYLEIMTNFNNMNSIVKDKKIFNNTMDAKLDVTPYMTKKQKFQFLFSTNEAMFNMIQLMKYHKPKKPLPMPTAISDSIKNSLNRSKDEVLVDKFGGYSVTGNWPVDGSLYTKFIHPIQEYQRYLDSNGVRGMIDKLVNTELFLIPQYCYPENFLAGNILFSKYYSDLFMIAPDGSMSLNKLSDDPAMISKFHNIVENLKIYYDEK